jgi:hypothetical protein
MPVVGIQCLTPSCPDLWAPLGLTMADIARLLYRIRYELDLESLEAVHGLVDAASSYGERTRSIALTRSSGRHGFTR